MYTPRYLGICPRFPVGGTIDWIRVMGDAQPQPNCYVDRFGEDKVVMRCEVLLSFFPIVSFRSRSRTSAYVGLAVTELEIVSFVGAEFSKTGQISKRAWWEPTRGCPHMNLELNRNTQTLGRWFTNSQAFSAHILLLLGSAVAIKIGLDWILIHLFLDD